MYGMIPFTNGALSRTRRPDLFDMFWGSDLGFGSSDENVFHVGPEVEETDDQVSLSFNLPGCDRSSISVTMENSVLSVAADRKTKKGGSKQYAYRATIRDVDPSKIEAEYKDGVLVVTAAKPEKAKPKKIPVKGE